MEEAFIWRKLLFGGGFYLEEAYIWRRLIFGGGFYLKRYSNTFKDYKGKWFIIVNCSEVYNPIVARWNLDIYLQHLLVHVWFFITVKK